jgi:riboflavin biosynthesis pyrimidine reductase
MSTVDGRIISENWSRKKIQALYDIYEKCHRSFDSQAWMCGRVTLEKDFVHEKPRPIKTKQLIAGKYFIGDRSATSFAIAVDPRGKLGWKNNEINGDHIIEILSEQVTKGYLAYLQRKSVSYIFAGKKEINFKLALNQLAKLFAIKTIMLEGGGHVNGSLLNAGLIDGLSLLIIPMADGTPKSPTTFEVSEYLQKKSATILHLKETKELEHGVIWLKYSVEKKGH